MATNDLPDWQTAIRSVSQPIGSPLSVPAQVGTTPGFNSVSVQADASWRSISILCRSQDTGFLYFELSGDVTDTSFNNTRETSGSFVGSSPVGSFGIITLPVNLAWADNLTLDVYNTDTASAHDVWLAANMTDAAVSVQGNVPPSLVSAESMVLPVVLAGQAVTSGGVPLMLPVGGTKKGSITANSGASAQILPVAITGYTYVLRRWSIAPGAAGPWTGHCELISTGGTIFDEIDCYNSLSGSLDGIPTTENVELANHSNVTMTAWLFFDEIPTFSIGLP